MSEFMTQWSNMESHQSSKVHLILYTCTNGFVCSEFCSQYFFTNNYICVSVLCMTEKTLSHWLTYVYWYGLLQRFSVADCTFTKLCYKGSTDFMKFTSKSPRTLCPWEMYVCDFFLNLFMNSFNKTEAAIFPKPIPQNQIGIKPNRMSNKI